MAKASSLSTGVKWAVLITLAYMVFSLLMLWFPTNTFIGLFTYVIFIGGIILALRDFRTNNGGVMTYEQGLGTATLTGVFLGLLLALLSYMLFKYIDPVMLDEMIAIQKEALEQQQQLDEETMATYVSVLEYFRSPSTIGLMVFAFFVIMSFIVGLIASIFLKKAPSY